MTSFKPLLACEAELDKLRYPLLVSPKLDGIRCIIHPTLGPVTRNLKPIRNDALRERLAQLPPWLDGELIAGSPTAADVMQRTTSAVMSSSNDSSDVKYYVFDTVSCDEYLPYEERLHATVDEMQNCNSMECEVLDQLAVYNEVELMEQEGICVEAGFEGLMLRDPSGRYKFGRSTVKEGILLKLKRFHDMEGRVVGFVERMHNGNEATIDALGHKKRSSSKKGKVGTGTLGALVLEIEGWASETVEVGSGFTDADRHLFWGNREHLIGQQVTFKYQKSGAKDAPRFPVFKGFREDM